VLRWLADENFNNDILRALFGADPNLDIVRAQDTGLTGIADEVVLEWAAEQDRLPLTHDVSNHNGARLSPRDEGRPHAWSFEISRRVPIRSAVEDILLITECSNPGEWEAQVRYLPLG
jgi:hypothetical protein